MRLGVVVVLVVASFTAQAKRARDWGIPFEGTPRKWNAITDVPGVEVGMTTLDTATPAHIHTGVTVIFPAGKTSDAPVPGAWSSLNGNGELTGTTWLEESGFLEGPIALTGTHSVGIVRDAIVEWGVKRFPKTETYSLPVVGETWDGELSDANGFHVRKEHVFQALDGAVNAPVAEGNVGGGTGMILCEFKGGTGTASRAVGNHTLGVLVQANYGNREDLWLAGIPVGRELISESRIPKKRDGSIIAVVATDAPLLPHQLKRLTRRVAVALGRGGAISRNTSGDIFVAFSTARPVKGGDVETWHAIPNSGLDPFFVATVQATEEAVANVLFAAKTMTGRNGLVVHELPADRIPDLLKKYGRNVAPLSGKSSLRAR